MTNKFTATMAIGATLVAAAAVQAVPSDIAHAYTAGLDGAAECLEDGSVEVTWTFVSATGNPEEIDIVSPASIAESGVATSTDGEPTTRTFTETYPAGTLEASASVTVEYFWNFTTDPLNTNVTSATTPLPTDCESVAGGEWCSPGYWRQPHHLDSWDATGISTDELYEDYFGDTFRDDPTLLEVLENPQIYNRKGTGAFNNVGDLLSMNHPDVDFDGERAENCPLN